jgi:hypothetical protein
LLWKWQAGAGKIIFEISLIGKRQESMLFGM